MIRVREFLTMGVREVWVLDPATRTVQVCVGSTITEKHDGELTVPATPISLSVPEIFHILDEA